VVSDLAWLGLAEAATLIAARKLSPVELTEALLARIEVLDPKLNAFLRVEAETALAEAKRAEAEAAKGQLRGPLHGVPFGLKDIIDAAGLPTTAHSKLLMQAPPAEADAVVTARLKAAGGILIGKTATHEFAIGGPSFDLPWPPARNPWNPGTMPGGSSSGSGAGVAAGLMAGALGSDTGGSVRNPASSCAIVGIKPTYGRVSRRGVAPLSYSLDHVGPLTRTVADNALMLSVIAGHDPADPGSARVPVPDFAAGLAHGVKGCRLGVIRHFYARDIEAAPEMAAALERALEVLTGLGAEIVEIETRPLAEYAACNRVILLSEAFAIHRKWLRERPEDYAASTRERLLPGAFFSAADYVDALRARRRIAAEFEALIQPFDAVLTASAMDTPPPIDDEAAIARAYSRQARAPFNLTGNPALAMPSGFSEDGLPLSIQIVGKQFDEAGVYRVAAAYEAATPWKDMHPPMAAL
jgi:aspartyl-tRNA(Asn)/glutamyl-tRNA(Gln) amidotransferase subunit A